MSKERKSEGNPVNHDKLALFGIVENWGPESSTGTFTANDWRGLSAFTFDEEQTPAQLSLPNLTLGAPQLLVPFDHR
jgi:hypothetical protein